MYICQHFSVYIAVDNLATASESLKYSEHNGARLLLGYLERTNISEIETFIFQTWMIRRGFKKLKVLEVVFLAHIRFCL